ncbi:hypothetical protein, partial [Thiolapillus sp.]|uniref:hypothetical protein n=1 Tax=Thiolapillus sp. TaxID=2017437 RepID=UPI0025CF87A0
MSRFEDKLILSHWMLAQFCAETLEAMGNTLSADHLIGFNEENSSKFVYELMTWMPEESREVKDDQLRQYDCRVPCDYIPKRSYPYIERLAHAKPGGSITPWLSIHKPVQHQSCVLRSRLNVIVS